MQDGGTNPLGGTGDEVPMQRLEEVEKSIRNLQGEFLLMQQGMMKVDAQREIIEETQKRHDEEIRELKIMANETREVNNRLSIQYNSIYTTLLQVLQQTQQDSAKERTTKDKLWMDFAKLILGGTIFIIVAYFFTRGG